MASRQSICYLVWVKPQQRMRIAIGSDHGGFALKESLKKFVQGLGHEVKDFGNGIVLFRRRRP